MSRPTVAIIEPSASGHRMFFAGHVAAAALLAGVEPTIITDTTSLEATATREVCDRLALASKDSQYKAVLKGVRGLLPSRPATNPLQGERQVYARLRELATEVSAQGYGSFFLPYMDTCARFVSLMGSPFGRTPMRGLVMRPSFQYRKMGVVAPSRRYDFADEFLFRRLLTRPCVKGVFTIDPTLHAYASQTSMRGLDRLILVPDPADLAQVPENPRKLLGLGTMGDYLLLYGTLDGRKGIQGLLAAATSPLFPKELTLLIAGRVTEEAQWVLNSNEARLLRAEGRLLERPGFQSDEEQAALFHAASFVWVGYVNHFGSSGVLAQAAAASKPVIATREGLVGWQTKRFGLGITVNPRNPEQVAAAARNLLAEPSGARGESLLRFAGANSLAAFQATVSAHFGDDAV